MENLPVTQLRTTVAQCCRALHALGLVDMLGHVSARVKGTSYMVICPRPGIGVPSLNIIGGDDMLVVDMDSGRVVEGRGRPPAGVWMHSEVYRRRPDVGGIVHTHQKIATAFGIVNREIRPLITQGAEIAVHPIPVYRSAELIGDRERGRAVADTLGDANACHLQGHGVVVVAGSVEYATISAHGLEESATMNVLAAPLGKAAAITQEDVERHLRDRLKNPPGGAPLFHHYRSIDPGPRPLPAPSAGEGLEGLKHDTATACHILYHFGLVKSLEHVSIRIPGTDRFTFSPSLNMGQIQPDEVAVMDLHGNHLEGPVRPPLYIWAFIEIYKARPDVQAIVHTHERYGRAFTVTGRALQPLQRDGAHLVTRDIPVHRSSDLLYDSERGRAFAQTLGQAPIVHSRGHGTEYVSETVQMSTNWAVLLEKQAEMNHVALQLGKPQVLPAEMAAAIAPQGPGPEVWWQYYRTLVA